MEELNLPGFSFKTRKTERGEEIWDEFRKKYIVLTREEWVRQHFLKFLNTHLGYPRTLLKTEFEIKFNKLKKRPDIVAYDRGGKPLMVVECKSPEVTISEQTFQQIAVYNRTLRAPLLVVTNGREHYCCEQDMEAGTYQFKDQIPAFKD